MIVPPSGFIHLGFQIYLTDGAKWPRSKPGRSASLNNKENTEHNAWKQQHYLIFCSNRATHVKPKSNNKSQSNSNVAACSNISYTHTGGGSSAPAVHATDDKSVKWQTSVQDNTLSLQSVTQPRTLEWSQLFGYYRTGSGGSNLLDC